MSRIQIPIDMLTSRLNLSDRFAGVRSQSLTSRFANLKPVSEFFDFKRLSKPANFGEVQSRVNYNLSHFSSNYFVVFLMLSIYSLLTNWVLLFDIILVVGGMWSIGKLEGRDLELGTMRATSSQLYTGLLVVAVPLGFFRGGGLGGRPRSPKVVPPWGRPSGAKGASRRRKQWDWEEQQARVEELDSDDTDTQGVGLGGKEKRFASDPLQFLGTELASTRVRKSYVIDDSAGSSSDSEESEVEGIDALQIALREKEEALVQSALKRIRRAQEKGKSEVKLNKDELDALENRRKRMQAEAAAKARKESESSSGSEKKRRSDRNIFIPLAMQESLLQMESRPSSSRRSSKGKSKRVDEPTMGQGAPAFMLAGADGLMYAPNGSPQHHSPNRNSTSRPRASTTSQPIRGTGPNPYYPYQPGMPRYVDNGRPASSASNRSRPMPDEEGWVPTNSRRSSGASSYVIDPFEYQVSSDAPPPIPPQYMQSQQHSSQSAGRRAVSGPQDVSYSSRRSLPPGASFQSSHQRGSIDPFLYRHPQHSERDELEQEESGSSSSEDEDSSDHGVQVSVDEREAERERERALVAVPRKPVGGGKKNRRR